MVHNPKTLVVCTLTTRKLLTGETSPPFLIIDHLGAKLTHFNTLRGLNEFNEFDAVVVIGRQQANEDAVEEMARALWWDDEDQIEFIAAGPSKLKRYEVMPRGYRLRSGAKEVRVSVHPDKRCQAILEQMRESESCQAIDRLRLLRSREECTAERNVFILSNVPLDITVDNLFGWRQFLKAKAAWEEADGVVPLRPGHLHKGCPKTFPTERSARDGAGGLKMPGALLRILNSKGGILNGRYKVPPQTNWSGVLYASDLTEGEVRGKLGRYTEPGSEVVLELG